MYIQRIGKKIKYYWAVMLDIFLPSPKVDYHIYIEKKDHILVVSPHPDDECIGCGALLSQYAKQCDVLLMTDGRYGNPEWSVSDTIAIRNKEFDDAMSAAGVHSVFKLNFVDSHMPYVYRKWDNNKIDIADYSMVFIPNRNENHPDHKRTFMLLYKKIKKIKKRRRPKVFEYEVWTTIIKPDKYLCMDESQMNQKSALIKKYQCQLKHIDYDKRIKGLNQYRGMMINSNYAEAYRVCKL